MQFRERGNHCPNNPRQELNADLVIDASGASSHVLQWLEQLGYKRPKETVVETHLGYATQHYQAPEHYPLKGIVIQTTQPFPRGGTLMTVEKGHWLIGLGGVGNYPPTKQKAFLDFAGSLPDKTLYEATQTGKPTCASIYGYRRTENRRRHFEQIRHLEGLVVDIGDALCTFNPTYGQGMTISAMEAQALDACLTRIKGRRGLTRTFQRQAARILNAPVIGNCT